MSQFINATDQLVSEALDALLRTQPLSRLDGYPDVKVLYRAPTAMDKVVLISGGGSGHEPAHAGFIAEGMLDAAVCGEVFASPSVDAVLAAILAVTGTAGCLLIVKNYTGDRLNFGLAAEKAKALGKRVEVVVVGDDIALPDLSQPRGLAGTLFVHKIAGHLAARGEPLERVAAVAREVAAAAQSIGVALDNATLPGSSKDDRVPEGKAELGLGIHGEPGAQLIDYHDVESLGAVLMQHFGHGPDGDAVQRKHSAISEVASTSCVMLLNNLGGTTPLEMQAVLTALLKTPVAQSISALIGPATLMTSLDMHGFSVSLLPARADWLEALQAPIDCAAWPGCSLLHDADIQPLPEGFQSLPLKPSHEDAMHALLSDCCVALAAMQDDLNTLDAKSGDGDTGSTVAQAARSLASAIDQLPLADTPDLLQAISDKLSSSMGGSSGVLLAILFAAASDAMHSGCSPVAALREGANRMMEYGGARLGDRTLLDALVPALDDLLANGSLESAASTARLGAENTQKMSHARAGRSIYVPESALKGVTDPGAEAVARLFEMLARR